MPTHKAESLIHCHRAYDESQETGTALRRSLWEWEAQREREALRLWECDNLLIMANNHRFNKNKEYCRGEAPRP